MTDISKKLFWEKIDEINPLFPSLQTNLTQWNEFSTKGVRKKPSSNFSILQSQIYLFLLSQPSKSYLVKNNPSLTSSLSKRVELSHKPRINNENDDLHRDFSLCIWVSFLYYKKFQVQIQFHSYFLWTQKMPLELSRFPDSKAVEDNFLTVNSFEV